MEQKLAEKLALPAGAKVLDAGCGMCDVASYLAAHKKLHIEGIDILDFNIKEANKRIRQRGLQELVHVQEMSYSKLGFTSNTFDGVYTMETFVHAADPKRTLKEFYRVLKPGGKIVMFEYSRDPDEKMSNRAARAFREVNEWAAMPAFQQFNHGVQARFMEEVGFVNIKTEDISNHMLPMLKIFAYVAYVPYGLLSLLGKQRRAVNAMSAVEFYRYRKHIRYNIYTAIKPV